MDQFIQSIVNIALEVNNQLTPIGCLAVLFLLGLLLIILKIRKPEKETVLENKSANNELYAANPQDIQAIAGEDEIATQLDLARAYIEMDQKSLAQGILQDVLKKGNSEQQRAAQTLLASLVVES